MNLDHATKPKSAFVILHNELFENILDQISGQAFKLYYILRTYSDGNYRHVWPSLDTLAQKMGVSVDSVGRYVKELVGLGLIEVKKNRQFRNNIYHFKSGGQNSEVKSAKEPEPAPQICRTNQIQDNKKETNNKPPVVEYCDWLMQKGVKIHNPAGFRKWLEANWERVDKSEFEKKPPKRVKTVNPYFDLNAKREREWLETEQVLEQFKSGFPLKYQEFKNGLENELGKRMKGIMLESQVRRAILSKIFLWNEMNGHSLYIRTKRNG